MGVYAAGKYQASEYLKRWLWQTEGTFITNESWIDSVGNVLLAEKTEYHFTATAAVRIIDRITTLTATGDTVKFKDTKEGMFGIRVARQLLPSKEDLVLKESNGGTTTC